jgi:hypothetical protein
VTADERADERGGAGPADRPGEPVGRPVERDDEPDDGEPGEAEETVAGLTRSEMEAAALEGRQVAGRLEKATALRLLRTGAMTVVGRLLSASNATFFCLVAGAGDDPEQRVAASCVYKPIRGERPLYDFPDGTLACREVGAHAVSEASGWEIVPPTVMRDGPFGEGMVQLWMEVDESVDLAELVGSDNPALRRIAVLDAVLNNADRKGGHLLPPPPTDASRASTTASASPSSRSCERCCGAGGASPSRTRRGASWRHSAIDWRATSARSCGRS